MYGPTNRTKNNDATICQTIYCLTNKNSSGICLTGGNGIAGMIHW